MFFAPWVIQLLIGIALAIISFLLMPKPKTPKPDAAKDMEGPTSEAGRPLPVIFGTITVKGLNCLWFGDKKVNEYQVEADAS
jgi:hypothetical protein